MSSFHEDPKAAFDAESQDHAREQTRALSMLSGAGGASPREGDGPLGLGAGDGESRGMLGHTTAIIALVAVVAAGSLYGMRVLQKDDASPGKEDKALVARLDNWLTKSESGSFAGNDATHPDNIKTLLNDTDTVLRVLNLNSQEHQVPIEYVKQNPFTFSPAAPGAGAVEDPGAWERANAMRRQSLQMQLSKYQLDSIMRGKRDVAMINGELYQVGDHLGDFVIEGIEAMQVTLRNGQEKFALSINGPESSGNKRR